MSGGDIGTVIGGAIGFMVAGPGGISMGMSIGGMAGSLLMPDEVGIQDQYGPRLRDVKVTTSTYGASVNRVYGTYRIGGNMIWANNIKETKHEREEEVGKGGSEEYTVTWYTYSIDMAIGLCEGPITGVRKIWADSVKIYDVSEGGTTDSYRASEQASGPLTIYLGDNTQEIDWFLQSNKPDSPAYRNISYIVFNSFQLEKFGNRIPNITAEVVVDGELSSFIDTGPYAKRSVTFCPGDTEDNIDRDPIKQFHSRDYDVICYNGGTLGDISACKYIDAYRVLNSDLSLRYLGRFRVWYGVNSPRTAEHAYIDTPDEVVLTSISTSEGGYADPSAYIEVYDFNYDVKKLYVNKAAIPEAYYWSETLFYREDKLYSHFAYPGTTEPLRFIYSGKPLYYDENIEGGFGGYPIVTVDTFGIEDLKTFSMYVGDGVEPNIYFYNRYSSSSYSILIRNKNRIIDEVFFTPAHDILKPYSTETNMYVDELLNYCYLQYYSDGVSRLHRINLNDGSYKEYLLPITNSFFTNFHVDDNILRVFDTPNFKYIVLDVLVSNPVTVSSICQNLMLDSNIELIDQSLTETDALLVDGFYLSNIMSSRSAISVLQSAYLFDVIEDNFSIRTSVRGGTPSIQINKSDLGANTEIEIEHKRKLETELPKKVTVLYANKDLDYQNGSQSTIRIGGNSDNNITIELPIAMDDTSASKICEINMYGAWSGKDTYAFSLNSGFIDLLVGDVIELSYENLYIKVRIEKIIFTSDKIIQCDTIRESSYLSSAIGQDTTLGFIDKLLGIPSLTELVVLNAPALDNQYLNYYGVYLSACGYSDSWPGAEIFKSKDQGQTYNSVDVILNPIPNGKAVTALSDGPTTIWDLDNSVEISIASGYLEQSTIEHILKGNQFALLGSEVIQFVDVEEVANRGTFIISKLLRGRRGTEWATSTHSINEVFSLLNYNMAFDFSTINVERLYKGATFGKLLSEADEVKQTYTGVNLIPLSPSYFNASNNNFSDTITWTRRDRYVNGFFDPLPMSDTEAYTLKIYDKNSTLVRTATFTNEYSFLYTSQNKQDDGIVLGDNITYEIYQNGTYSDGHSSTMLKTYDATYLKWVLDNAYYFWRFDEDNGETVAIERINGVNNLSTSSSVTFGVTGAMPSSSSTAVQTVDSSLVGLADADQNTFSISVWISPINSDDICTFVNIGYETSTSDVTNFKIVRTSSTNLFVGSSTWGTDRGINITIDPNAEWINIVYSSTGYNLPKYTYLNTILQGNATYGSNYNNYVRVGGTPVGSLKEYSVKIDELIYFSGRYLTVDEIEFLYEMSQKETQ